MITKSDIAEAKEEVRIARQVLAQKIKNLKSKSKFYRYKPYIFGGLILGIFAVMVMVAP